MSFAVKPGNTVLFIGDSITDCGRRGEHKPLGQGYVKMITDLIIARYPKHNCTFINKGVGGNSIDDMYNRWSDDAVRFQPNWLSVMIGINDIHRWLFGDNAPMGPDEFAEMYDVLLGRIKNETKAKIIILEPFYITTEYYKDALRHKVLSNLPKYIKTVHNMAKKYNAQLVRTQKMFQQQLRTHSPDFFGTEPVHPYPTGHLFVAHEWLKVMGW